MEVVVMVEVVEMYSPLSLAARCIQSSQTSEIS